MIQKRIEGDWRGPRALVRERISRKIHNGNFTLAVSRTSRNLN
jgi:hypothetical protein